MPNLYTNKKICAWSLRAIVLLMMLFGCQLSHAQITFKLNSVIGQQNPSADGFFSYGTFDGSGNFILLPSYGSDGTQNTGPGNCPAQTGWTFVLGQENYPFIAYQQLNACQITPKPFPTFGIFIHPDVGKPAVIKLSIPTSAQILGITSQIQRASFGCGTNIGYRIRSNNGDILARQIIETSSTSTTFTSGGYAIVAGDAIYFMVDNGDDGSSSCDDSALEVDVTFKTDQIFTPVLVGSLSCGSTTGVFNITYQSSGTLTLFKVGNPTPIATTPITQVGNTFNGQGVFSNLNLTAGGSYYAVASNAGQINSAQSAIIAVSPCCSNAVAPAITVNNLSLCVGGSGTLVASGCTGGIVTWSNNAVGSTITVNQAGSYTATCVVASTGSCASASSQATGVVTISNMVINESATNDACGDSKGSITVNVSGGNNPLQYAINNGGFTGNNYFGGLNAGTYAIKVRDASGCETSKIVNLTNNPPINLSASSVNVNCAGQNTGSITLNASGGAGFFQYSIDGSTYQSSNVFTNVGAGSYTCYVKDVANCVKTTTVNVGLNSHIIANVSASAVKCFGGNDGSISVNTTGSSPTGNLQFSLNNVDFQGSNQFNNLVTGNYTCYIKDNLCSITRTITVSQPTDLVVSLSKTQDVLCYNGNSGIVDGNASGGTVPYQFSLDGTTYQPSNHFTGLSIGTYKLWVKDANNCVKQTNQVTLTQPTDLIPSVTSKTDANCFGDSNGTLVVAATGGVSPYVFSVDGNNFQNSPINNLRANTYTLSVKDANGCIKKLQTSIGQPTQLTINLVSKTNLSCYQNKTGRIEVSSSGGTLPYQFTINNTTNASFQSSGIFEQLAANTYTISGKDAHNCPITLPAVTLTEPTDIFITMLKKKDVDCEYYQRGEALILATGSNGNFTYTLAGLTFTGNGITPINNTSGYFPQLKAGNYTLTASDQRACAKDFTVTIIPKSTNIGFDITKTLPSSCTAKDGSIGVINARGGRPPYQYGISTQATFSPFPNFSNLLNGNYIITVADSLCSYKQNVDLSIPNSLKASYTILPIDCNVSNANLSVAPISGGNGNYQLSLNNGTTSSNGSPSDTFYQNLAPAVYAVTITDQPTTCQTVLSLEIKEQNRADLQLTAKTNIACFGDYSGSITVAGNNNLSPFQYALNNKNNWQNGGTFNNLPAGTYQVYAKNNRGCLDSLTILLTQPTLLVGSLTKEDNLCFGDNTGKIHASATGGVTPYQYSLDGTNYQNSGEFQGLKAGFYTVRVKDSNQCIKNNDIELIQPTLVKVQPIYADTVRCYGESNGRVQVIASGGTPNYQYSKDSLSYFIDNNFTNLKAGNYTFYVKDSHGCIQKNSLAVTQPDTLVLRLVNKTHPLCYGTQDGTILVSATGGNNGNIFTLDNTIKQKDSLFTALTQANYTVRVTDRKGCLNDIKSIPLVWPKAMDANIIATPPTCVGFSNGSIQVNLQGGTPDYSASLSNVSSLPVKPVEAVPVNPQNTYDKLSAGDYHITIYDKNACQLILPVKLIQPDALNPVKLGKDTTVCIAQIVTLNANNKGQDISWYYNDKLKAKSDTIHAIATGLYKVVVKNKTGCTVSDSIQVKNNKTALVADFLMAIQAFVGDTVVVLDISKPTPDQIIWTLPSQANTIENKMTKLTFVIGEKGEYTIKMLARKGECFNIKERQLGIFRKEDVDDTDPTLHYKDYNIIQSITTYPNPNFGKFTVDVLLTKAANADLTITRVGNAQVVYQESKKGQSKYTFDIILKNFVQGVYIVTVRSEKSTLFRNVVIQN